MHSMANDLNFVQTRCVTARMSGGGRCVLGPREMKGDLRIKGLKLLGNLGKKTEKYGIQKGKATRI